MKRRHSDIPAANNAEDELMRLLQKGGKRKKPPLKRVMLACAGAVMLAAGITALVLLLPHSQQAAGETVYREYTVERGDITVGQTESSSISLTRETVTFPVSSTVEDVYIKAGSSVQAGDPLVRFNSEEMAAGLNTFELQLEIMALELEQAKLDLDTKMLQAKQQLETSKQTGTLATDNRDVSIDELQLALDKAQTALSSAKKELENYVGLADTFEMDYRNLISLEDSVDYYTAYVSDIQSQVNNTTDYAALRDAAEAELISAWKIVAVQATNLSNGGALTASGYNGTGILVISTFIEAYYNMKGISPGAISGDKTEYTGYKDELSRHLSELRNNSGDSTVIYNLNALLSALSDMEKQAANYESYTASASGASSKIASLKTELESAQAKLSDCQSAYDDFKSYYTDLYGNISGAEELTDKIITLEADAEQARLNLDKAELSAQTGELSAEQKRETALNGAGTARAAYELTEMELSQQVSSAQEAYDELNRQIEEVKALLNEDGIVYAACNGMIASVNVSVGDSVTVPIDKETKKISSYAQLLVMTNISDIYVPITISEEDILKVSIGQAASVTMTAFPSRSFDAVVDTISVESARIGAATISYNVTVHFSEENALNMYEGMSAEVTLIQRTVKDVLYVSAQAVTNTSGAATVLKRGDDGESIVTAEVKTGFSDGRYVEILSGLSEGDVVLAQSAVGRS